MARQTHQITYQHNQTKTKKISPNLKLSQWFTNQPLGLALPNPTKLGLALPNPYQIPNNQTHQKLNTAILFKINNQIMPTLAKLSVSEYHQIINTGIFAHRHIELIEGYIWEMAPEGPLHAYYNNQTVKYLRSLLANLAEVREAHPITLSDSEPEPDIAIVKLPDTKYINHHPLAADIYWLIEIADSTLTVDLTRKQRLYANEGIAEYWVVDVNQKVVHVFRQPQADGYSYSQLMNAGTIIPLAFSQIQIKVENLLPN